MAEKHVQIREMDRVYSGAVLTFIAAAGDNAESGLPGVGDTPRKAQPGATVQGRHFITTLGCPEQANGASKWATRGWTYQEAMLSTRRLVFLKDQTYFECKSMYCRESIGEPISLLYRKMGTEGFRMDSQQGYFEIYLQYERARSGAEKPSSCRCTR